MAEWRYAPPAGPLVVVHHDRDLLVVDKPSGLLSVPGRDPAHHDSALSRAQHAHGAVYAAHRLDLDTSGLLMFATRRKAERALHAQFRERTVEKRYVARVDGLLEDNEGAVDLPLARETGRPRSRVCHETGRPARTRWRVLSRARESTLVALTPETGRSHQLRVHLAAIGHPILGDRFYGSDEVRDRAPRLLLHAHRLSLAHPYSGELLALQAPVPFE